jgi:DNA-binding CsgD family transcriptional regulator
MARLDAGDGIAFDLMDRVAELQRDLPYVVSTHRADYNLACWFCAVEDLDRARRALTAAIADARDHGDDSALGVLYGNLAQTEIWAGRYASARQAIDEGWRNWTRTGGVPLMLKGADILLRLLTDDIAGARARIAELAEEGAAYPDTDPIVVDHILGVAATIDGDAEKAVAHLSRAYTVARDAGRREPGRRHRLEGDLGQALVTTGRLDDASALATETIAFGERTGRAAILAMGLRIQGLVHSARGELDAAADTLRRAVAVAEQSPIPFGHGRSLLALGQVCRRLKLKGEAVRSLQAALDCFTELGATAFARQAQAELGRGQRSRSGAMLTTAERQVAELVAGGATNRETAAQLFTSVRTVEGHLAAVYRKVGVRSRSELAKRYNAGQVSP